MRRSVKHLAGDVCELACELSGFGPYAEDQIAAKSGVGVERRLLTVHEALSSLLEQLRAIRADYIGTQLRAADIKGDSGASRLHIGCGSKALRGWINVDSYPAPLAMSALWDLPFSDSSVTHTFVSRIPGVLFFPSEIRRFLSEVRRVLVPGGILRIDVTEFVTPDLCTSTSPEAAYRAWAWGLADRTRIDHLLGYFGTALDHRAKHRDRRGFNVDALMYVLADEGYTDVVLAQPPADGGENFESECETPICAVAKSQCPLSYVEARKST